MAFIVHRGVKFHWNFKLLAKGFRAITLFGHVYTRMSKQELKDYLKTSSADITANHEKIHMMQAKSMTLGYFGFYTRYIGYWVKGLFKYKFNNIKAYHSIPFEKEAFANQYNLKYKKSKWKNYK